MSLKIVDKMSASEYHASPGVSASLLKSYSISAAHGRAAELGKLKRADEAMNFGSACHAYILEPKTYLQEYITKPEGMSFATKDGKSWRSEQTAKIISKADEDAFDGMSESIASDPIAGAFIKTKGRCELSLFDDIDGTPVRARFDKLTNENVIVDLKTTISAQPFKFVRQAFFLGWHIQAAWYCDMLSRAGMEMAGFVFIAVEKDPPYAVLCAEFDSLSLQKGRNEYERLLELYDKCHKEQRWPGYVDQKIPYQMTLPKWAMESQQPLEQQIYELEAA